MSGQDGRQKEDGRRKLTVARKRVHPFVERRIEVGDDALLPLLVGLVELRSRLVGRVLEHN